MQSSIGERVCNHCATAREELVIVAPFMKVDALLHILRCVSENVTVRCVTRWHMAELAMGVSDIGIWHIISGRPLGSLWLRDDLHAKYYRADSTCLIGSANVTGAALGWSQRTNLEIVVQIPAVEQGLPLFERDLFASSVRVDDRIYSVFADALSELGNTLPAYPDVDISSVLTDESLVAETNWLQWLPNLRNPKLLHAIYLDNTDSLSPAAIKDGKLDLAVLNIPNGLSEVQFNKCVAAQLLQKPLIAVVDEFLITPRRFGEVRRLIGTKSKALSGQYEDSTRAWQTLMRWFMYFLPTRYRYSVPNHSEIFQRTDSAADMSLTSD